MNKKRLLIGFAAFIGVAIIALIAGGYAFVRESAPQLDGDVTLQGLSVPVTVTRDALGVPSIAARNPVDLARVLGYLHAQDRLFQMDLLRRLPAGDLAALVGPAAVKADERHRLFRLRAVAREVIQQATPEQRAMVEAYTAGVNAGLNALKARPFEYGLLRQRPEPWRPEDTILVIFAMYFDLQDSRDSRERDLALLRDTLPAPLFDFLNAPGTKWDAPLVGSAFATAPIPASGAVNIRNWPKSRLSYAGRDRGLDRLFPGSGSMAVDAAHSADGHAILANDMHLGLGVPNIWYRAQFAYPDPADPARMLEITGVTLPGAPVMVVGSNGHVAWGFTDSYGNWAELVELSLKPDDPGHYRTPDGWRQFVNRREVIEVAGQRSVVMNVRDTIWGPVVDPIHGGISCAIHWIADDPAATNLALAGLATAKTVEQAMAVANRAGIPAENFLVVDSAGNIAWTIAGRIPIRQGYDPELPAYWDKPGVGWTGWLDPDRYPRVVNPPDGRLWTANNRIADGSMLSLIGDGGYDLGARAQQMRDDLMAKDKLTPSDMLHVELDDRAVFLGRWHDLLLKVLGPGEVAGHPQRAQFLRYVKDWGGRAAVDSVGYRLVRDFRHEVEGLAFDPLIAPCRRVAPGCNFTVFGQREGPLWELVTKQPMNMLSPAYESWSDLMLVAVDRVIRKLWVPGSGLETRTWGQRNTVRIDHPISGAVPFLSHWIDMPPAELPGDTDMPRVQGTSFGASERMVVEPADQRTGIFEMPTGESGYPLSPYYGDQETAWEQGRETPFLPGAAVHTLKFRPAS